MTIAIVDIDVLDSRVEHIVKRQEAGLPLQATALKFFSRIARLSGGTPRFALDVLDVVTDKYPAPEYAAVADALNRARALWQAPPPAASYDYWIEVARRLQAFQPRTKSINAYARRRRVVDRDLRLCESLLFYRDSLYDALAPWVCQQEDLRYRFSGASIARLTWLHAWWRHALAADSSAVPPAFPVFGERVKVSAVPYWRSMQGDER